MLFGRSSGGRARTPERSGARVAGRARTLCVAPEIADACNRETRSTRSTGGSPKMITLYRRGTVMSRLAAETLYPSPREFLAWPDTGSFLVESSCRIALLILEVVVINSERQPTLRAIRKKR